MRSSQILGPRADEFRQRIALMVALAEEDAVRTQTGVYEARVLDEDALQANDFVQRERVLAGLQDRAAPAFQAAARRPFALDLETGAAVGKQHETGRARHHVRAGAAQGFPRLCARRAPEIRER